MSDPTLGGLLGPLPKMPDDRVIYGPCPACHSWQLEARLSTPERWVEEALLEHDSEDHPGVLVRMAMLRRDVPVMPTWAMPREGWM